MENFFTWNALLTYSGAVLATTLLTQFLKEIPVLRKLRTRILSYSVALTVILLAMLFEGSLTWGSAAVSFINAAVVALAANGAFDAVNSGLKAKDSRSGGGSGKQ